MERPAGPRPAAAPAERTDLVTDPSAPHLALTKKHRVKGLARRFGIGAGVVTCLALAGLAILFGIRYPAEVLAAATVILAGATVALVIIAVRSARGR
jgi:hypothetical protein